MPGVPIKERTDTHKIDILTQGNGTSQRLKRNAILNSNFMKPLLATTILLSALVQSGTAVAQEDLSTILDRGTPAIWYVCGPFESDLPDGIVDALSTNQPPLGRFDFLSSQGGTSRFRPSHGLEIKTPSGKVTWLRTRTDEPTVDLSPFFAEQDSGIAFAAFFAESLVSTQVLLELQTILGARVFLNGEELKNITGGPIGFIGVDHIVANFRAGENLLLLEIPGVHLETLAKALDIAPSLFPNAFLKNRSHLNPKTGFEFTLRMQEVKSFENLLYTTQLVNTGIFSGSGGNIFQDVWLTLFNPSEEPSASLEYSGMAVGASARFQKTIPPIAPRERHLERISIPIAAAIPGQPISVQSNLTHGLESARWQSSVVTAIQPKAADLFFVPLQDVSEQRHASQNSEIIHAQKSIQDKIKLAKDNEDYGFSLGPAENWFPVLTNHPELRQDLAQFRDIRSITAWNTHSRIDHRIANGETLIRNLQYGNALSTAWLALPQSSYWSWNAPAIAPQLPQILSDAKVPGLVHNVDAFGLPSLYYQLGLDGSTLLHRKKVNTPALRSLLDVHQSSAGQHRFWQQEHLDTDLLVYENHANAPEPFWTEKILPLPEAIPSITVTGSGADRYFASLLQNRMFLDRTTPLESRPIQEVNAFGLLANPELTDRLAALQQNLLIAETMSTLATRVGATFPYDAMDHAWRSLLSLSAAGKLSGLIPSERKTDYLALMRTLDASIGAVTRDALAQLAGKIHTQTDLSNEQGAQQALVVFNPSNWTRSDLVESVILPTEGRGLTLMDDTGRIVPFEVLDYTIANNLLRRAVIQFVATDVPSLGHKTYYFTNTGGLPQESTVFTPFIENDLYRIEFNNGDIASIQSKRNAELIFSDRHFNELVAYHTVPTTNGPEWNGDITRSSEQTSTVTMERTALGQRATVTTPFLEGTLVRTVTLRIGIPRIDLDVELKGVSRSRYVFAAEFSPTSEQLVPILGQAFGRVQGVRDRPAPLFDDNTTAQQLPAPNVSRRFHALARGAGIEVGEDAFVPLAPAMIIHPGTIRSIDSATELQRALMQQGIPSSMYAYDDLDTQPVWRDDSLMNSFRDDVGIGTFFTILIGNADQNPSTEAFLSQFDDVTRKTLSDHLSGAHPVLAYDENVPFGHAPMPTLILGGDTSVITNTMVLDVVSNLQESGELTLQASQALTINPGKRPRSGFAIFHQDAALSQTRGGRLTHYLYAPPESEDLDVTDQPLHFRYAVFPFSGGLRDSQVSHQNHAYSTPLISAQTTLHPGSTPSTASAVSTDAENFIMTSLKPMRAPDAFMGEDAPFPEALILRGYETAGVRSKVRLTPGFTVYASTNVTPLEAATTSIETVQDDIQFDLEPYDIKSIALYVPPIRGVQPAAPRTVDAPLFSRGWTFNEGPIPLNDQRLVIRIHDPLPTPDGSVTVTVGNNSLSESVSGDLTATVSKGWAVVPDTHTYRLSPGASAQFEMNVTRQSGNSSEWGLLAQTEHEGRVIYDTRATFTAPVEVGSARKNNEYLITIKNPGGLPLIGRATIVSNFDLSVDSALIPITPLTSEFHIAPYEEKRILYTRHIADEPRWLHAKITVNGQTIYHNVTLDSTEAETP